MQKAEPFALGAFVTHPAEQIHAVGEEAGVALEIEGLHGLGEFVHGLGAAAVGDGVLITEILWVRFEELVVFRHAQVLDGRVTELGVGGFGVVIGGDDARAVVGGIGDAIAAEEGPRIEVHALAVAFFAFVIHAEFEGEGDARGEIAFNF